MGIYFSEAFQSRQEALETPPADEGLVVPDASLSALLGLPGDSEGMEELPGG